MSSEVFWPRRTLAQAGVSLIDCDHRTPPAVAEGFPYIAIPQLKDGHVDLNGVRRIAPADYVEWTKKLKPRANDVIVVRRCNSGDSALIPPGLECAIGQNLVVLRSSGTAVEPKFLRWLVRGPDWWDQVAKFINVGAVFDSLRCRDIPNFELTIPPLADQREIAALLDAVDSRIALLRETNATLEAIAQALFRSWFVDFDPVRAKSQGLVPAGMDEATAALFPDGFEESALGSVPSGWPTLRIEELAERVGMGPFGSNIKVETFVVAGIPVLNGANVQGALLEDTNFRFVTEEHAARLRNSCVRAGDIVLTHRGTLGQVSLVPSGSKYPEYVLSQSQFFLRCAPSIMEPEWMLYFLRSPIGRHLLLANSSQVGVPSIARPSSYLRSMKLVVPPFSIVSRFAEVVRTLHGVIVGNRERVQTLGALRDALLPRLISGQLRLPEALPVECEVVL
jgi:type I restriction enzyme, S subunit